MKSFCGLLLLAVAAVSISVVAGRHDDRKFVPASVVERQRIGEILNDATQHEIDVLEKSEQIVATLKAEKREPTAEEKAVLTELRKIHARYENEMRAAGIIQRRASAPVERTGRRRWYRKYADLANEDDSKRQAYGALRSLGEENELEQAEGYTLHHLTPSDDEADSKNKPIRVITEHDDEP